MTLSQLRELREEYRRALQKVGIVEAQPYPRDKIFDEAEFDESERRRGWHRIIRENVLFMLHEVDSLIEAGKTDMAMFRLGTVQNALWVCGYYTQGELDSHIGPDRPMG